MSLGGQKEFTNNEKSLLRDHLKTNSKKSFQPDFDKLKNY